MLTQSSNTEHGLCAERAPSQYFWGWGRKDTFSSQEDPG